MQSTSLVNEKKITHMKIYIVFSLIKWKRNVKPSRTVDLFHTCSSICDVTTWIFMALDTGSLAWCVDTVKCVASDRRARVDVLPFYTHEFCCSLYLNSVVIAILNSLTLQLQWIDLWIDDDWRLRHQIQIVKFTTPACTQQVQSQARGAYDFLLSEVLRKMNQGVRTAHNDWVVQNRIIRWR